MLMLLGVVPRLLLYAILLLLGFWCYYQWKHWKFLSAARKLYPSKFKPLPVVGHVHHIVKRGWDGATRMITEAIDDALDKNIDTMCLWIGPIPYIIVMGARDVQKVLTSSVTSEKPEEMKYFNYAAENGLLTAPNNIWKITRRHINPLFHSCNLSHLMSTFNGNSRELVLDLSRHAEGPDFDVLEYTMKTALQSVCHLIFGSQMSIDKESEMFSNLLVAVESIPELFLKKLAKPWLRIDAIFKYVYSKELKNINEALTNFTSLCMQKEVERNGISETLVFGNNESGGKDTLHDNGALTLIDVYNALQAQFPEFNEKSLRGEISTFYATGTDTVGSTVATCLLALGQYPEVQEMLIKEIRSVMQEDDDVTLKDLNSLLYLDQVYKETLRWSCLIPFAARSPNEDMKLSSCTIGAGWTVAVVLAGVHMDPKTYPQPKVFSPDRFSQNSWGQKKKYSFLPFSGGPRSCIGKEYSNMLVKVMLIHILRKYRISTDMDFNTMKRKYVVTLVSSEGYRIKLHKRCQSEHNQV